MNWWRRRKRKVILMVMRADDMLVAHPQTDYSHVCSQCGEQVGIYPSGQRILKTDKATIICNRCHAPDQTSQPAPGALDEVGQSRPVSRN
jgi:hypothetical protein